MPGEGCDGVQLPAHAGEIGQAEMPRRMRGELRDTGGERDPAHNLRPRPQAERLGPVASGLREEQRAAAAADGGTVIQVGGEQHARRGRVGHRASPPGLGRLGPDPDHAVSRVEVVGAKRAQLLAPQGSVIGESEHEAVADRLVTEDGEHVEPLLLGRDPRQLHQAWHEPPVASEAVPGAIAAASDRVRATETFFDEEVVEEADRDEALLQRGVGEPGARVEGQRVRPVATRAARQLPNEGCDLGPAGDERVDAVPLAVLEVLSKPARIGVDRPRRPTEIGPDLQPLGSSLVTAEDRPLLLQFDGQGVVDLSARGVRRGHSTPPLDST